LTHPLVSVICLCYNQKLFVREAVESVLHQTYRNVQLIVVDDASTDGSVEEISRLKEEFASLEVLLLETNHGNCAAFNRGLTLAKGQYLIDLAADDALLPNRVEKGVNMLALAGKEYGVHFSDAEIMDESGKHISYHSDRFPHNAVPQGDIYKDLIEKYFICSPTVMFTREVIEHLQGYDEGLTYEDFDFWIRSSRKFRYSYSPEVLVKKRIVSKAMTHGQFRVFSKHSLSTYRVCEKIMRLNQTKEENAALSKRILYEAVLNLRLLNFRLAFKFLWLRTQINQ
jgi:glycosyltransferase involved in cell wall biosynthesis